MNPSTDTRLTIERVRCFIKWHEGRFGALDAPHEPIADPIGWKRGGEHWIRPDTWRDTIFDGDESAAQDAARSLRDLGLLRTQDGRNCQAVVVCVRDRKSERAYAVKPEIREWRLTAPAGHLQKLVRLAWFCDSLCLFGEGIRWMSDSLGFSMSTSV